MPGPSHATRTSPFRATVLLIVAILLALAPLWLALPGTGGQRPAGAGTVDCSLLSVAQVSPVGDPVSYSVPTAGLDGQIVTARFEFVAPFGLAQQLTVTLGSATVTLVSRPDIRDQGSIQYTLPDPAPANISLTFEQTGPGRLAAQVFGVEVTASDCTNPALPVITVSNTLTAETGRPAQLTVTATDPDGGPVTLSLIQPAEGTVALSGSTVTYTSRAGFTGRDVFAIVARDDEGSSVGQQVFVTVRAETDDAPELFVDGSTTAEATSPAGAVVPVTVRAVDDFDATVVAQCDRSLSQAVPVGTTTVTCTATDSLGQVGRIAFDLVVTDTTAPRLQLQSRIGAEATGPGGATISFSATATDIVDGTFAATCIPPSGSTFPVGRTIVSCSATDGAGNRVSGTFPVDITDSAGPVFTTPGNLVLEATDASGAVATFTVTATDAVSGPVEPTCTRGDGLFPIGTTTISCTATATNAVTTQTSRTSFTVTVRDTTGPVFRVSSPTTTEATGPGGASVAFGVSTTDAVDPGTTASCDAYSGQVFPIGSTTVTCTARDATDNASEARFAIVVSDTTGPVITIDGGPAAETTYTPDSLPTAPTCSATDLVSGVVACTVSGYSSQPGPQALTFRAMDSQGNETVLTRSYTVTSSASTSASASASGTTASASASATASPSSSVLASVSASPSTASPASASPSVTASSPASVGPSPVVPVRPNRSPRPTSPTASVIPSVAPSVAPSGIPSVAPSVAPSVRPARSERPARR